MGTVYLAGLCLFDGGFGLFDGGSNCFRRLESFSWGHMSKALILSFIWVHFISCRICGVSYFHGGSLGSWARNWLAWELVELAGLFYYLHVTSLRLPDSMMISG